MAVDRGELLVAISRAQVRAEATGSLLPVASPRRAASSPVMVRPVNSRSVATGRPTSRGRSHAMPYSATSPRRANVVLRVASEATKRASALIASTKPIPAHGPLMAVATGVASVSATRGSVWTVWPRT